MGKNFDLDVKLTKYSWSWVFCFRFNRFCIEYEEGVWEIRIHKRGWGRGFSKKWGKRRPWPVIK